MASFNKSFVALLLVALLASAAAFPSSHPDEAGSDGGSNSTSGSSGSSGGGCSKQKVCTGSLAKIDLSAKIGSGVCVLDSLTKKLLFFKNKCARNMSACSNKSSKYTDVEPKKCSAS